MRVDDARGLLERATFGFTQAGLASVTGLGWAGWVESQLHPNLIPDSALDLELSRYPSLQMSVAELFDTYADDTQEPMRELMESTLLRAAHSERQLLERVVSFWSDHFNVAYTSHPMRGLRTMHQRILRERALGTFSDLLHAVAQSPGMLFFLDNWLNTAAAPNENFAREVMELHTLGVDGGYDETDVQEVARCFTGWTMEFPWPNPQLGEFRFRPEMHDGGERSVLGVTIPAGGLEQGRDVLDLLAAHPATARHLASKLCRWFLAYEPGEEVIEQAAAAYLASGGEIRAMLRTILAPRTLGRTIARGERKLRRPFHYAASLLRQSEAVIHDAAAVTYALEVMGQSPGLWSTPDGYPDTLEAWGGSLLPRWAFAAKLFTNQIPGVVTDAVGLLNREGAVAKGDVAERVNQLLAGGRLDPADVIEVQRFVDRFTGLPDGLVVDAFVVAASSPSYLQF